MRSSLFARITFFLGAIALVGCGKGDSGHLKVEKLPTVPAGGKVLLNGKPLADASVSFLSKEGKVAPGGKTDSSGAFTLSSYGQNDGAPVGSYKVVVAVSMVKEIQPGVLAPYDGSKSPVSELFGNPETTPLKADVTQGGPNQFTLEVK